MAKPLLPDALWKRIAHLFLPLITRLYVVTLCIISLHGVALASDSQISYIGPMSVRVSETTLLGQVTGAVAPTDTATRWDVHGTDLGHMFWHRDKLYMVFGDTFGAGGYGGKNWRSNTMARISNPDPQSGLPIAEMVTRRSGKAKELLLSRKINGVEKTIIPTYGISIDGRMYLHYMSVRRWGGAGHWDVRHSGFAYSDDDGHTWKMSLEAVWPGGTGFEQVALILDGDYLYTFGIPGGRFGGVRLRRVSPDKILVREAYVYWDGEYWTEDPEAAVLVVPPAVGELSVAWSAHHGQWLMMYLNSTHRAIVLRTAPLLTGPWGEEQIVVTAKDYPGLYAPYIVPGSALQDDVYFTMSLWKPYNVFLMRASLEGLPEQLAVKQDAQLAEDLTAEPSTDSERLARGLNEPPFRAKLR